MEVDLRVSEFDHQNLETHSWQMRSVRPSFQIRSGDVLLLSELTVVALEAMLAVGTRIWANFVRENSAGFGCVDVSPSP